MVSPPSVCCAASAWLLGRLGICKERCGNRGATPQAAARPHTHIFCDMQLWRAAALRRGRRRRLLVARRGFSLGRRGRRRRRQTWPYSPDHRGLLELPWETMRRLNSNVCSGIPTLRVELASRGQQRVPLRARTTLRWRAAAGLGAGRPWRTIYHALMVIRAALTHLGRAWLPTFKRRRAVLSRVRSGKVSCSYLPMMRAARVHVGGRGVELGEGDVRALV